MSSAVTLKDSKEWIEINSEPFSIVKMLGAVVQHLDLLKIFVRRDFVVTYKQTILGPLWALFQPAMVVLTYTFVFARIAKIPTEGVPAPLFYLSGIIAWTFFSTSVSQIAVILINQSNIVSKVFFPRLILPLGACAASAINSLFQMALFALVMIFYHVSGNFHFEFGPSLLLLPLLFLHLALISLGVGLIISTFTIKYRDLVLLLNFLLQLGMYSTPVIYPLSVVPEKWQGLILYNPLTPIILGFKYCLSMTTEWNWTAYCVSLVVTFSLLLLGLKLFQRMERKFVDLL